jgi:hypothetical protein
MKWHELKRHIVNSWKRRWVRVSFSVLVLAVVICVQYSVSRLPQSQDVEEAGYSPAISRASQQEIVIREPLLSADNNVLLSFHGKNHQTVEFHAVKARLAPDTLSFLEAVLKNRHSALPSGLNGIDYLIENDPDMEANRAHADQSNRRSIEQGTETASCLTIIEVRTIDQKLPSEIRFYQPEKGNRAFQALEILAIGAELEVQIRQSQPDTEKPEGDPRAAGCKRKLIIGNDWAIPNTGELDLSFIVPANTAFRFDFHALAPTASLQSGSELFEPFVLGEATLKGRTLSVRSHEANEPPSLKPPQAHFFVQGAGNQGILSLNGLRESDEELQLSLSGVGLVEINGEAAKTSSLFETANQYPIIATICALANVTLAGWILRNIFAGKAPKGVTT